MFFGCLLRGVLVVPLDAAGSLEFAKRVITEVTPKLVVGADTLLRGLAASDAGISAPMMAFSQMDSTLPLTPDFDVDASVQENAPFQIVFTSGTTSEPKGIVHTLPNVLANLRPIEAEIDKYRKYERWVHPLCFLHTLPVSHVFGQFMGLWMPAILAAELHFSDRLEPTRTIDQIRRERISVLIAVPRVPDLLRAHLLWRFPLLAADLERAADLSLLKRWWRFRSIHRALGRKFWTVISGGAALSSDLEGFWNQLGFVLIQGYGLTETASLVTLNHPLRIGKVRKHSSSRSRGSAQRRRRDHSAWRDDLWGYVATGTHTSTRNEWLATGDLAEQNDSGAFRFIGRKSDVIVNSNGINIHPSDMEAAMQRQPGIRKCAVVPCEIGVNIEAVCVVISSGDDAVLQKAVRRVNQGLAEYQQIRRIL